MFLKRLLKDNKIFINESLKLYKKGNILPDTYIIDVDTLMYNAKNILDEANKYDIKLYYMLKQIGRNPYIAKKLENLGYKGAVCVDFKEAEIMMQNGLKLGNVGHLVQIPKNFLKKVINYGVEIITVYSLEMMKEISKIALELGKIQDIMIRVIESDSNIYIGQEAGLSSKEILDMLDDIKNLKGIKFKGLTSFPCFLYSLEENAIKKTNNLDSVINLKEILKEKGIEIEHINLPSATSIENLKDIKKYGGTHAEPGHSLTGTSPINKEKGEIPAYLYISEISHNFNNNSYFYGGGYYPRANMEEAYIDSKVVRVNKFNSENIDYYLSIDGIYEIFNPIILSFRTQIFVTRSDVVLLEGLRNNNIKIVARYTSNGLERGF